MTRRLVVAVHDVAPPFRDQVEEILSALAPLDVPVVAAATPRWHAPGSPRAAQAGDWRDLLAGFDEVLAHGLSHRRLGRRGLVSRLTGNADELASASRRRARELASAAAADLEQITGRRPRGFLPPAWQLPARGAAGVRDAGFEYVVRYFWLEGADLRTPLRTWSWDWGVLGSPAALLAERLCAWEQQLRRPRTVCVALHPADVRRGLASRARDVVGELLAAGYSASTFDALAATGRAKAVAATAGPRLQEPA